MFLIDILLISGIVLSIILGYVRGFIGETLRLFCWIGASVSTYYTYIYFDYSPAFIIIFFIIYLILFKLIQFIIEKFIKKNWIKIIDRPLGILYGSIRAFVILLFIQQLFLSFKIESHLIKLFEKTILQHPVFCENYNKIQIYSNKKYITFLKSLDKK